MNNIKETIVVGFEGGDGAGKGTQIALLTDALKRDGWAVTQYREPGSTSISEQIRRVILDNKNTDMDALTELLLYMAARRQMLQQELRPEIESGRWDLIVLDRYWFSSAAYQGGGRGLGLAVVSQIANIVCEDLYWPDAVLYFDISIEVTEKRLRMAAKQGREFNRLDQEDLSFHQKVRDTYLEIERLVAEDRPGFWWTIDASGSIEEVHHEVINIIRSLLVQ